MLTLPIILLVAALGFSIFAWLRGRPRKWIFPSDGLFIASLVFIGLPPLVNIRAETDYSVNFFYEDLAVARALYGIALMFTVFGLVWSFRPVIKVQSILAGATPGRGTARIIFAITAALATLSLVIMIFSPEYRKFRMDIFTYMVGNMYTGDYSYARRFEYNDNVLITQIIGRLRFSIFAFLFAVSAAFLFVKRGLLVAWIGILLAIFLLLASSLSKLPFVYFIIYAGIIFVLLRTRGTLLTFRKLGPAIVGLIAVVILLLIVLYKAQYPEIFVGFTGLLDAGSLALFRVFGATYDAILQYFTVFPHIYDFSYLTDSSVVAALLGKAPRDIALEVPTYFIPTLEYGSTTTPTAFIGGAYASLGYPGVVIFSLIVAVYVCWLDGLILRIQTSYLRVALYATTLLNVVFFAQVAAPPVFLTYGLGVIPLLTVFFDGGLFRKRQSAHEAPTPKAQPRGALFSPLRPRRP